MRWRSLDALKDRLTGLFRRICAAASFLPVRAARKTGYAVSDGLVLPNVRGVGVAIARSARYRHRLAGYRFDRRIMRPTNGWPTSPRCCGASRRGSSARCATGSTVAR